MKNILVVPVRIGILTQACCISFGLAPLDREKRTLAWVKMDMDILLTIQRLNI